MISTDKEPKVSMEIAAKLGLSPDEFARIKEILGRKPNYTELSIFSVMWSEHCSYKNSIAWLKKLPRKGPHLLAEAGDENAGLVDIGDGLACAFKIESHNHPSAIEPYQGAATGVGGIHRDIFTMGARPLAALNSLRFGNIKTARTRHLMKGIVKGIGDYGNCLGIPTVAGETYFEDCYEVNPLVNAMSVGIVEKDKVVSAISKGPGNPVFIVGSATGKDGIHGATFASEDISDESGEKLPSVQVGDPFQEKLLLEASLEVIDTHALIGMQDMGAAGITCSSSEMSEKGHCGMRIDLDKVPMRQADMKPFEILLSESQERMLVVVEKGKEASVKAVFDKWDLNCTQIGEVTGGNMLQYFMHGDLVAEVPADVLVLGGGAPVYHREYIKPAWYAKNKLFDIDTVEEPENLVEVARHLATHPNIASKHWIYHQYDSMVGLKNTVSNHAADAAVIRIPETNKGLVITVDCNGRYVQASPEYGAMIAVAEAARNIVCSGGKPVAITNCLNFGNPYDPEVYWHFVKTIQGMSRACLKFNTPVTGGNVSFYNQSADGGAVYASPVIGMLGLMENPEKHLGLAFNQANDLIYLLGSSRNDIACSQYLDSWHHRRDCPAPYFDLDEEFDVQNTLSVLHREGLIRSAHDVSDGGLFISLLESAIQGNCGFNVQLNENIRTDAFLFGESQSRIEVSVDPEMKKVFEQKLNASPISWSMLGTTCEGAVKIGNMDFGSVSDWAELYEHAIEHAMEE